MPPAAVVCKQFCRSHGKGKRSCWGLTSVVAGNPEAIPPLVRGPVTVAVVLGGNQELSAKERTRLQHRPALALLPARDENHERQSSGRALSGGQQRDEAIRHGVHYARHKRGIDLPGPEAHSALAASPAPPSSPVERVTVSLTADQRDGSEWHLIASRRWRKAPEAPLRSKWAVHVWECRTESSQEGVQRRRKALQGNPKLLCQKPEDLRRNGREYQCRVSPAKKDSSTE